MSTDHYGIRRRDGNASDAIAAILNPSEGHREKLKKKGITPKDYERENKLRIKLIQQKNREQRLHEEAAKREAFKLTRFKGVRPRVYKHEQENDESNGGYPFLRRGNSEPSLHSERTTSEQQQQQQSSLPPAFHRPEKAPTRVPLKEPVPSLEELEERNRELVAKMSLKERTDFVNSNAWEVIKKSPPTPARDAGLKSVQYNRSFGRIPKYLLERKEQWAREEEERRRNAPDPDCPPGMMLLDEDERLRTLRVLRKSLDEARLQINHLPLRIETPNQIRRKNALEAKLQEIEDAIKVFDRTKVYVAIPLEENDDVRSKTSEHSHSRVLSGAAA
uniref:Enkurin domain-containing protein n=1 Tax=Globisporangium ultimum (strain ATCC 200006 / CBS 805.95 / DAOM BR144) TaxID=431595 RepID=K3WGJ2_GLOUD